MVIYVVRGTFVGEMCIKTAKHGRTSDKEKKQMIHQTQGTYKRAYKKAVIE